MDLGTFKLIIETLDKIDKRRHEAYKLGRNWIGSELNPEYIEIAMKRLEPYLAQKSLFEPL